MFGCWGLSGKESTHENKQDNTNIGVLIIQKNVTGKGLMGNKRYISDQEGV